VHPAFLVFHELATHDVVADVVHERAFHTGNDFLKGFEHEGVDQHVVHGREIRTERHVVEIGVGFGGAEWRVHEFLVLAGQRNAPRRELALQHTELVRCEVVAEAAGTAVREKRDATIAQAEHFSRAARAVAIRDVHGFAFAEMIAAAVGTELAHFVFEFRQFPAAKRKSTRAARSSRWLL